jgi:glycosyltransferase involved in cell wall biosynthesis
VERVATEVVARLQSTTLSAYTPPPGRLAEQFLALSHRHSLLWSPCNFGPIGHPCHVVTVHDVAPLRYPELFRRRYVLAYRAAAAALFRRARSVVTVSSFSADELADCELIGNGRAVVIRNGVDGLPITECQDDECAYRKTSYFLSPGTADPRKRSQLLVDAFEAAAPRGAELWLYGLKTLACTPRPVDGAGSSRSTKSLGRVTDAQLSHLYAHTLGLFYLSVYEGFGLPPGEAHRAGARVVVSDIPPMRELLDGHDNVTFLGSNDEIGEVMVDLISAASPENLCRTCATGLGLPTWARAAKEYDSLFAQVGRQD